MLRGYTQRTAAETRLRKASAHHGGRTEADLTYNALRNGLPNANAICIRKTVSKWKPSET